MLEGNRSFLPSAAASTAATTCLGLDACGWLADVGVGIPLHWFHGPVALSADDLGPDGLPRHDDFDAGHRRVMAAIDVAATGLLAHREPVERRTRLTHHPPVRRGEGKVGIAEITHELAQRGSVQIRETELSMRLPIGHERAEPAPPTTELDWAWCDELVPSPLLLFQCSALMLNAHRIHFDRPFAVEVEGYDDLVVNGHLAATLACNAAMARRPGEAVLRLQCRAIRPLFAGRPMRIHGRDRGDSTVVAIYAGSRSPAYSARITFGRR